MIRPDEMISLTLTAADIDVLLAALSEMPFRRAAPVIERLRTQILQHDPAAFDPPMASAPRVNGIDVRE